MIEICPKDKCTGCTACMNVCPKDAISMKEDGPLGFMYPFIDANLCIDCHLCEKTCPVNHPIDLRSPQKAFAATSKDEQDLMTSTSGGASSVFVQTILGQGGIVYGCVQKNYTDIAHRRISNQDEAFQLKGSKYVQSNIGYIYRSVKKDLQQGVPVLFTGTPCQIAGLQKYLKRSYENLYLVDLVCHGVPSQRVLQENVQEILKGKQAALPYVHFRKKGEQTTDLVFGVFLDKEKIPLRHQIFPKNDYIAAFMSGVIFRKNCFTCPYAQKKRGSDVTIADFWGIGQDSTISNDRGISLMLVNSDKGQKLVNSAASLCNIEERPVQEAIEGNGQLQKPSVEPTYRNAFIELYSRDKKAAYTKYLKVYRKAYYKQRLKDNILKNIQRNEYLYLFLKYIKKQFKKHTNN